MIGDFKIICTDKGQHHPALIQRYVPAIHDGHVRSHGRAITFAELEPAGEMNRGHGVVNVPVAFDGKTRHYCRTCKRDPRLSTDRLAFLVNKLLGADRDTLDISYID